jgi:hypothetical protein
VVTAINKQEVPQVFPTELTKEVERLLSAPVPANEIQTKRQGGSEISFTSDKFVMKRLDEVVGKGGWEDNYEISLLASPAEFKCYTDKNGKRSCSYITGSVVCRLTVLGKTKSGTADLEMEPRMYGTPATNAQAKAFKRAAMKFGIAAELWNKDETESQDEQPAAQPQRNASFRTNQTSQRQDYGRQDNRSSSQGPSDGPSQKQFDYLTGDTLRVPEDIVRQLTPGRDGTASQLITVLKKVQRDNADDYEDNPAPFIVDALRSILSEKDYKRIIGFLDDVDEE